jgi:putative tryptophan/tyrosine transport system substrate-binding protein
MRRRELITLIGCAAAWPLTARAQEMSTVGYLNLSSAAQDELSAFQKGLAESGFVEGRNLAIEYRWASNESSRLPELAADLIRRRVAVIAAFGSSSALAAKAATSTIPIVFLAGSDAVEAGLVASLSRPGGNATGINSMNVGLGLGLKRIGLLHEMVPQALRFGVLVQSNVPTSGLQLNVAEAQAAAAAIGRPLEILSAGNNREIDVAFASVPQKRIDALMVSPAYLFNNRRIQLALSGMRYGLPMIFPDRRDAEVGGLMSYGPNWTSMNRDVGLYVGRVLKGAKPSELPVLQHGAVETCGVSFALRSSSRLTVPSEETPNIVRYFAAAAATARSP